MPVTRLSLPPRFAAAPDAPKHLDHLLHVGSIRENQSALARGLDQGPNELGGGDRKAVLEADLESRLIGVLDHYVLEGLVVHYGGDHVACPGHQRIRRDRQRVLARNPEREWLDVRGDGQRALAENLHRVDLALVGAVVDRLDAVRERILEREEVAPLDVDEFLVEIEQEGLAPLLINENLSFFDCLYQRPFG